VRPIRTNIGADCFTVSEQASLSYIRRDEKDRRCLLLTPEIVDSHLWPSKVRLPSVRY
jgi:hypothetical protein